ncbi:MAG: hypothetical protein ACM3XP_04095 [Nitrososphaerales archaeon]
MIRGHNPNDILKLVTKIDIFVDKEEIPLSTIINLSLQAIKKQLPPKGNLKTNIHPRKTIYLVIKHIIPKK